MLLLESFKQGRGHHRDHVHGMGKDINSNFISN